jgi:hypothetical protein
MDLHESLTPKANMAETLSSCEIPPYLIYKDQRSTAAVLSPAWETDFTYLEVFGNEPRLECREEQAGRNPSQNAANHEHGKAGGVLSPTAEDVCDAVQDACFLAATAK